MKQPARQEATAEEQHAGVEAHRMPDERGSLVENTGECRSETFGWVCQAHHEAARALDAVRIEGIRTTVPLHRRIIRDPGFAAGDYDVTIIERLGVTAGRR